MYYMYDIQLTTCNNLAWSGII